MGPRHEDGRRNTFIGNITDENADMVFIQEEHIVKIAAYLAGRQDAPAEIKVLMHRQLIWQDRHLNIGGNFEFPFEPLFLDQLFLRRLELVKSLLELTVLFREVTEGGGIRIIQP